MRDTTCRRSGNWTRACGICTAFGGHGLDTTAAAGGLIASAIAEGDDRYRVFEPFGLAWNGGPLGPVAAQLTYWKLQLQDWWAERGVSQKKERKERASHA